MRIVLDASVVVKWFVEEEYSDIAILIRDRYVDGYIDIHSPSLMTYEVLNALKYSGEFGVEELWKVVEALNDYQFRLHDLTPEMGRLAVEISLMHGVTIYDASYVALAKLLDAPLYTADEKLLRKMGDTPFVRHLSSFKTD